MITTSDFKRGVHFQMDGEPYLITDVQTQSPSARGVNTLVKVKARNVITGQFVQKTFRSGEKFEEPDLENHQSQYLYREGDVFHFMDLTNYETHELSAETVGDAAGYLLENVTVHIHFFQSRPVAINLPNTVDLLITETEPAIRGDTVTAQTKAATLETGLVVQVPMFIEPGTKIRVDTRDARYIERVKG